mgnify:CR=1 FL=1
MPHSPNDIVKAGARFLYALVVVPVCRVIYQLVAYALLVYVRRLADLFLFFGVIMSTLVFLLRKPFVSLYQLDESTFALATLMIAICSVSLLGTTYHASCFLGINRGAGDNAFVAKVDSICGWLVVLPCTMLAAFVLKLPLPFVYLSTRIDQCYKWIIAFFRLRGDKWIHNVTRDDKGAKA